LESYSRPHCSLSHCFRQPGNERFRSLVNCNKVSSRFLIALRDFWY
jgi:hypothetical protein